jgi:poly-gamma-glutamate synthesis protein (capsule biosynthesis protein)
MQGDARFFNLETTLNYEGDCFASQFSGGTYVRTTPEAYYDMLKFGFNMTSANNNHAFDFSFEGFASTLEVLNESGITHSGIGTNIHNASAPAYLETTNGRVALVAVNTSFNPAMMAGAQSRRVPGRPGINGLRVTTKLIVPDEDFERIKIIADKTMVNSAKNITRAEGYFPALPDGVCEIGEQQFIRGDGYGIKYIINPEDLERLKASIEEASLLADYVIVSVHTHQIVGDSKDSNPEFIEELMHYAVDCGADAIIGHGPHLLRPIEVYRDKPIFYSLGDFVIQLYDVPFAPEDFYSKYGMSSDSTAIELLKKRSNDFTRGLMEQDVMLETVIPLWETEGKKLRSLKLLPVKVSKNEGKHLEGLPKVAENTEFIDRLAKLSAPYGVKIEMKDGIAVCTW